MKFEKTGIPDNSVPKTPLSFRNDKYVDVVIFSERRRRFRAPEDGCLGGHIIVSLSFVVAAGKDHHNGGAGGASMSQG